MKNRALLGVLLVVLALAGLGAFLFWRARTPPQVTQTVKFSQAPPAEQEKRRDDAQRLIEDVGEVLQSAKRKEHKKFRVVATEEQLNTLLQDRLDTSRFPIRDLSLGLQPDNVAVQGTTDYQGLEVTATMDGAVVVENNRLQYKVKSLRLGGFPAPAKLQNKVEEKISQLLNRAGPLPGQIESVKIEAGRMIVEGVTN